MIDTALLAKASSFASICSRRAEADIGAGGGGVDGLASVTSDVAAPKSHDIRGQAGSGGLWRDDDPITHDDALRRGREGVGRQVEFSAREEEGSVWGKGRREAALAGRSVEGGRTA